MAKIIYLKFNKMKRIFFTLSLLIGILTNSFAYDFSAVCESGQTLYYNILSETDKTVEITYYEYFNAGYYQYETYYYGVTAPEGDLIIPEYVQFNDTQYIVVKVGDNAFHFCDISSVTFPNSIVEIGQAAFYAYYHKLVPVMTGELVLPENLQILGKEAFCWNTWISAVCIPNSVKVVGWSSFRNCIGLKRVTIGSGVEEISYEAFSGCHSLDTIIVDLATPPTCQWSSFSDVPKDIPVLVPVGSKALYELAEYWKEFTNFIETESLAVNENKSNELMVFPNPTDGEICIDGVDFNRIEIYSILGQFIKDFKNNMIDVSDQGVGTYLLKVITPSGVITKQIIKK